MLQLPRAPPRQRRPERRRHANHRRPLLTVGGGGVTTRRRGHERWRAEISGWREFGESPPSINTPATDEARIQFEGVWIATVSEPIEDSPHTAREPRVHGPHPRFSLRVARYGFARVGSRPSAEGRQTYLPRLSRIEALAEVEMRLSRKRAGGVLQALPPVTLSAERGSRRRDERGPRRPRSVGTTRRGAPGCGRALLESRPRPSRSRVRHACYVPPRAVAEAPRT